MENETTFSRYVAAYALMHNPPLDSVNPHFNNRFSSLAAIQTIIHDACSQCGIAYRQVVIDNGTALTLDTSVMGADGEVIALSTFPLQRMTNPQQMGSQLTYAKRQAAQADWALAGETDDDAEAATQQPQNAPQKPQSKRTAPQKPPRDYSSMKSACERLASVRGSSVAETYRWIVDTLGDPKTKTDEEYENLVRILNEMEG